MKFAICNETFGDWPHEKAFATARECGYTGIEIAPFTIHADATQITPEERRQVRKAAEDAELEVVGLHWLLAKTEGYYLTSRDAEIRRATSQYLTVLAQLCSDLGGKVMVLGSPQQRNLPDDMPHEEGMQWACDVLQTVMPACERLGVTIAVEPLGPAEGNFLLTAEKGIELVAMVGSPHCQLHLDCKAMSSESKPIPEIIRDSRARMVHFHANDPNRLGPGMGELKFAPIFAALKEIDYGGWVSVEVFDYTPGAENIARQSMENMQAALATC